jgi:MATE family multidrug resistance protein
MMVGKLGPIELEGTGNSFVFYSNVLRNWFSTAITPLAAEADGKKHQEGRSVFQWIVFMHDFRVSLWIDLFQSL